MEVSYELHSERGSGCLRLKVSLGPEDPLLRGRAHMAGEFTWAVGWGLSSSPPRPPADLRELRLQPLLTEASNAGIQRNAFVSSLGSHPRPLPSCCWWHRAALINVGDDCMQPGPPGGMSHGGRSWRPMLQQRPAFVQTPSSLSSDLFLFESLLQARSPLFQPRPRSGGRHHPAQAPRHLLYRVTECDVLPPLPSPLIHALTSGPTIPRPSACFLTRL